MHATRNSLSCYMNAANSHCSESILHIALHCFTLHGHASPHPGQEEQAHVSGQGLERRNDVCHMLSKRRHAYEARISTSVSRNGINSESTLVKYRT